MSSSPLQSHHHRFVGGSNVGLGNSLLLAHLLRGQRVNNMKVESEAKGTTMAKGTGTKGTQIETSDEFDPLEELPEETFRDDDDGLWCPRATYESENPTKSNLRFLVPFRHTGSSSSFWDLNDRNNNRKVESGVVNHGEVNGSGSSSTSTSKSKQKTMSSLLSRKPPREVNLNDITSVASSDSHGLSSFRKMSMTAFSAASASAGPATSVTTSAGFDSASPATSAQTSKSVRQKKNFATISRARIRNQFEGASGTDITERRSGSGILLMSENDFVEKECVDRGSQTVKLRKKKNEKQLRSASLPEKLWNELISGKGPSSSETVLERKSAIGSEKKLTTVAEKKLVTVSEKSDSVAPQYQQDTNSAQLVKMKKVNFDTDQIEIFTPEEDSMNAGNRVDESVTTDDEVRLRKKSNTKWKFLRRPFSTSNRKSSSKIKKVDSFSCRRSTATVTATTAVTTRKSIEVNSSEPPRPPHLATAQSQSSTVNFFRSLRLKKGKNKVGSWKSPNNSNSNSSASPFAGRRVTATADRSSSGPNLNIFSSLLPESRRKFSRTDLEAVTLDLVSGQLRRTEDGTLIESVPVVSEFRNLENLEGMAIAESDSFSSLSLSSGEAATAESVARRRALSSSALVLLAGGASTTTTVSKDGKGRLRLRRRENSDLYSVLRREKEQGEGSTLKAPASPKLLSPEQNGSSPRGSSRFSNPMKGHKKTKSQTEDGGNSGGLEEDSIEALGDDYVLPLPSTSNGGSGVSPSKSLLSKVKELGARNHKKLRRFSFSSKSSQSDHIHGGEAGTRRGSDLDVSPTKRPSAAIDIVLGGKMGDRNSSDEDYSLSSLNQRSLSICDIEEYNGPFVGEAFALVDCISSPYDLHALSYKKGDVLQIIEKKPTGSWKGKLKYSNKVGYFKFINVQMLPNPEETENGEGEYGTPVPHPSSSLDSATFPYSTSNGSGTQSRRRTKATSPLTPLQVETRQVVANVINGIRKENAALFRYNSRRELGDESTGPGEDLDQITDASQDPGTFQAHSGASEKRSKSGRRRSSSSSLKKERPRSVGHLLKKINLEEHIPLFILHGFESLDLFKELEEEDLDRLAITELADRVKIMTAVELLHDYDATEEIPPIIIPTYSCPSPTQLLQGEDEDPLNQILEPPPNFTRGSGTTTGTAAAVRDSGVFLKCDDKEEEDPEVEEIILSPSNLPMCNLNPADKFLLTNLRQKSSNNTKQGKPTVQQLENDSNMAQFSSLEEHYGEVRQRFLHAKSLFESSGNSVGNGGEASTASNVKPLSSEYKNQFLYCEKSSDSGISLGANSPPPNNNTYE